MCFPIARRFIADRFACSVRAPSSAVGDLSVLIIGEGINQCVGLYNERYFVLFMSVHVLCHLTP